MDLCATKTHGEREDEEADRLVRPSPKIKPPRRDLRREHTEAEDDPDLKADQNVDNDPDLSLNRKRTAWRVFARHILAKPRDNRVPAWDKKEKRRVDVSPETLAEGGDYEPYKDQDKQEGAGDETSTALQELMQDPATAAHFKELLDPSKQIGGIAEKTPTFPAARLFPKTTLPKGVETVGDLVKALRRMPKPDKKPKKKKAPPAAEAEPPKAAPEPEKTKSPAGESEAPAVKDPAEARFTSEPETSVEGKPGTEAPAAVEPPKVTTPEAIAEVAVKELGEADVKPVEGKPAKPKKPKAPKWSPEAHLQMLGAKDAAVRDALLEIADPDSKLGKLIRAMPGDRTKVKPEAAIPSLKGKLPTHLSLDDVVKVAEKTHPPRKLTRAEAEEADRLLDGLPSHVRRLMGDVTKLHPDEILAIAQAHKQFADKPPNAAERQTMVDAVRRTGYHSDPRTVPAPTKGPDATGKVKPFSKLTDDEKVAAWNAHRAKVLAQCAVARASLVMNLAEKSFPHAVANTIADMRLNPARTGDAEDLARQAFDMTLSSGSQLTPTQRREIQNELKDSPQAQQVAVGVMQAADYEEARQKYLGADAPEAISEFSSPRDIARGVVKAMADLDDTTSQYPPGSAQRDTARLFRDRVLQRLKTLKPEKYQAALAEVEKHDTVRYQRLERDYEKAKQQHEAAKQQHKVDVEQAKKDHERAMAEWEAEAQRIMAEQDKQGGPYRAILVPLPSAPELVLPPEPLAPVKPTKPVSLTPEEAADLRANLFKAASRSSYAVRKVMKRAVYHGVDPYPAGLKPYTSWLQAHQRDFSATDHAVLVESAQAWLKSNYLTANYVGAPRDTQLRAALDLAIRTTNGGAYAAGVTPPLYEAMLRDLADVPPGGTLLTIREAGSSYAPTRATTGDKTMTMPKFAAEQANGLLTRLDKIAHHIQANFKAWGMPFETAKQIVNDLDKTADEIEVVAFGQESFAKRQAEVIMKNPDEPYMSSFENPQQPRQVDADEPYMSAFKSDDSSGVHHGKAENGRPLAP